MNLVVFLQANSQCCRDKAADHRQINVVLNFKCLCVLTYCPKIFEPLVNVKNEGEEGREMALMK